MTFTTALKKAEGCARFSEFYTIFNWTQRNWKFRRQKILNSKFTFATSLSFHFFFFFMYQSFTTLCQSSSRNNNEMQYWCQVEIENFMVRGRKTTEHKLQKIRRSAKRAQSHFLWVDRKIFKNSRKRAHQWCSLSALLESIMGNHNNLLTIYYNWVLWMTFVIHNVVHNVIHKTQLWLFVIHDHLKMSQLWSLLWMTLWKTLWMTESATDFICEKWRQSWIRHNVRTNFCKTLPFV